MLDEHDRESLRHQRAHELAEARGLRRIHAGGGFIKDQEPGLGRERARDLETALVTVREAAGESVRPAEAEPLQELTSLLAIAAVRCAARPEASHHVRTHPRVPSNENVLQNGEALEEPHALKGARDAARGQRVRRQARDVAPGEPDRPAVHAQVTADEIHERRLAGAVRTDEPEHLTGCDGEVNVGDGVHAAESLRDAVALKQHRQPRSPGGVGSSGARRASPARGADR